MNIVTVSREFGSGGRELAKRLADVLSVAYYDREIITAIAKESELNEEYVERVLAQVSNPSYPVTFSRTFFQPYTMNINAPQLFAVQHKVIKKIAQKSDCVIVGRGANTILREYNPFRIFVYADMSAKIARCKNRAAEDEILSEKELRRKIMQIDKGRSENHSLVSDARWGKKSGYDLCINTTNINIKEIPPLIADYAKRWFGDNKK